MIKRVVSFLVIISFFFSSVLPVQAWAQGAFVSKPVWGDVFSPAVIKGLQIFPDDPLKFNFIVDAADSGLQGEPLKVESEKLIKYFLASLTTPERDMWVNLSPLEPDRIIPEKFGETEMGRDLLQLDKILKQAASSLTDPGSDLGREFWDKVYARVQAEYGTTDVSADVINKVWIMPEGATIYENGDKVFVVGTKLKVMLEADYMATASLITVKPAAVEAGTEALSNQIMRETIIPVLEKEVNEGKMFAPLRQIYYSMILATWFKRNLRESVLGKAYVDLNKTPGVDILDTQEKQRIYEQYLQAFKQGAYNFIKEEYDPLSKEMIPRKYFSGGLLPVKDEDIHVIGKTDKAMSSFLKSMALSSLVVLSVLLNSCEAPSSKSGRLNSDRKPLTEQRARSVDQVPSQGQGNYADRVHDEFYWEQWAQDSIKKFRGMTGDGFENKSPREQIISLGFFIKSPQSGLGVAYDRKFLKNTKTIILGGDLEQTIQTKRTVCLGFARLFYFMLGHSVEILEVPFSEDGHAMNLVTLQGGKVILVDLSTSVQDGFIMSAPFVLEGPEGLFERVGDGYKLKDGQSIPWDHQNFIPAEDLNELYETFKISDVLPYDAEDMFSAFEGERDQVFKDFDQGNKLFESGDYQEAIVQYKDVVMRAADLKTRMENNVVLPSVFGDFKGAVDNLGGLMETAASNIKNAEQNVGALESGSSSVNESPGEKGNIITHAPEAQIKQFEAESKEIQRLMSKGAAAIEEGNAKQDNRQYKLAKSFYKEVQQKVSRLKADNEVCKENPHIFDDLEKALKFNLDQLKDMAEMVSVDNAANGSAAGQEKSIHFIFDYHYSRALNIERLKEAIQDPAVDVLFLEEAQDPYSLNLLNALSFGKVKPDEARQQLAASMENHLNNAAAMLFDVVYNANKVVVGAVIHKEIEQEVSKISLSIQSLNARFNEALFSGNTGSALQAYKELLQAQSTIISLQDDDLFVQLHGVITGSLVFGKAGKPVVAERILVLRGRSHTEPFIRLKNAGVDNVVVSREFLGEPGAVYFTHDDALKRKLAFAHGRSLSDDGINEKMHISALASVMILNTFSAEQKAAVNIAQINRIASRITMRSDLDILLGAFKVSPPRSVPGLSVMIRDWVLNGGYASADEWRLISDKAQIGEGVDDALMGSLAVIEKQEILRERSVEELKEVMGRLIDFIREIFSSMRGFDDKTAQVVRMAGQKVHEILGLLKQKDVDAWVIPSKFDEFTIGDVVMNAETGELSVYRGYNEAQTVSLRAANPFGETYRTLLFLRLGDTSYWGTNENFFAYSNYRILKVVENVEFQEVKDKAQDLGGIDLNAGHLNIQSSGKKIEFSRFYSINDLGRVPGFVPVIMGMSAVTDISVFLGVSNP